MSLVVKKKQKNVCLLLRRFVNVVVDFLIHVSVCQDFC